MKHPVEVALLDPRDATPDDEARAAATLSESERRLVAAGPAAARRTRVLARAFARTVIGARAGVAPWRIRFARGPHGKPRITGPRPAAGLAFNVSHAPGLVACAVAEGGEVGVDVEAWDRPLRLERMAEAVLAPEESDAVDALAPTERAPRVCAYWCLKEAYVKALGTGLVGDLRRVAFEIDAEGRARLRYDDRPAAPPERARLRFAVGWPTGGHALALARDPDPEEEP